MEARNKSLQNWFVEIEEGRLKLPRFQRHEAWRANQIQGLLENILRDPPLPVGVLLVLEVGDQELFHSRPIVGAPSKPVRPAMHLLDGQQRMTALWRSLNDDYEDQRVFVRLRAASSTNDTAASGEEVRDNPAVEITKRWKGKSGMMPVWADNDVECIRRGLAPISILRPGNQGETNYTEWRKKLRAENEYSEELGDLVSKLRSRLSSYSLPFLALPTGTSRETALEVFINMNTSASPLKVFDIVVAQVEEASGESLHDKITDLLAQTPGANAFDGIEDRLLSVAALLMNKPPVKTTFLEPDFSSNLSKIWPNVVKGLQDGIKFLRQEAIFTTKSLPTEVAFYLVCALWGAASDLKHDSMGQARRLIRKALWRSCYTERYQKTSATRAYSDFRAINALMHGESAVCELFDERTYPLPALAQLSGAGWPGTAERLPRAILATTLRRGGFDLADGGKIDAESLRLREFDHVYSFKHLGLKRDDRTVNVALNCALIMSETNRRKSGASPDSFILERVKGADLGEVKNRLSSHLINYESLIKNDYPAFLENRAKLVWEDMVELCEGREPSGSA